MKAIDIKDLSFSYDGKHMVLKKVNFSVEERQIVALVGPSGVGKSTLLRCINRLIKPTAGEVKVLGKNVMAANRSQLREIRRMIGVIFQQFNLFDRQKVIENVLLGRLGYIAGWRSLLFFPKLVYSSSDYQKAEEVLNEVGLKSYANKRVFNLSGGQKQRVAIARALVQQPKIILADEPVSNLDPFLAEEIMKLLTNLAKKKAITIVASLHSLEIARKYSQRLIGMAGGRIIYDGNPKKMTKETIKKIYGKEN